MSGIAINEDDSHFYGSRNIDQMTIAGLKELVDNYYSPQMKELIFNPNAQRTSFASKVWIPIWQGFDPQGGEEQPFLKAQAHVVGSNIKHIYSWLLNAWTLNQKGIDPYKVWLAYTREKGMGAWLSMRMNDVHDVHNPDSILHSDFWREHPEFRRVTYRFEAWNDRAFDYERKEVREYHLALIKEYFERYDLDGLELDWMRFGYHFRPGHEEEGRRALNELMAETRKLADGQEKIRGHRIRIGVRVPTRPQTARAMGMDAIEWAKKRLVDMIVVTPFFSTCEFDIPIEMWKELLGDLPVTLAAGLEIMINPFPAANSAGRMTNTPETVRGMAVAALHRGADRIYLFNYMDAGNSTLEMQEFKEPDRNILLSQIGTLETATKFPRRHVVTYVDTWAPGDPTPTALPAECRKGRTATFRIHIGPKPKNGKAYVFAGLPEAGTPERKDVEVRVNGELCPLSAIALPGNVHPVVKQTYGFDVDLKTMNDGYNVVEIAGKTKETNMIVWVEIKIVP